MSLVNHGSRPRVHSLDHFALNVPDLDITKKFYTDFGLEVVDIENGIALKTFSNPHLWGYIYKGEKKELLKVAFGAYQEDITALQTYIEQQGCSTTLLESTQGFSFFDPEGIRLEVIVNKKVTPDHKTAELFPPPKIKIGERSAPPRHLAEKVKPNRLSHILLFTSDIERSIDFYERTLGLRLSDYAKDTIAFLHATFGADHHTIAFAQSSGKGFHHSSWDVSSIDAVGLGARHMFECGWKEGWGVGRHVLGSNYFYYAKDPWGSFCEYSYDIDFIPAGMDWQASRDHLSEDSLYLWGPDAPADFVRNTEMEAIS